MKIPKFLKRTAAIVLAAVSALSAVPSTVVFAAEEVGTISIRPAYDSNGDAIMYNSEGTFNGRHAGGAGTVKYRMFVDGYITFCIQPGETLRIGSTLKKASSDAWDALSAEQKKAIGLALLYGSQGNKANLSGSKDEQWLATQTIVWEFIVGSRETNGSFKLLNTDVCELHFGSNYPNIGTKTAYDEIIALLTRHNTIPSFMSESKTAVIMISSMRKMNRILTPM